MVISFSVKEAREQLMNEGLVYTFRWKRRSFFVKEKGVVESTWANAKRGGKRIAYVNIEEEANIKAEKEDLDPYNEKSGFSSVGKWWNKIYDMSNPYIIDDKGWLYKVTLKRSNGSETKE